MQVRMIELVIDVGNFRPIFFKNGQGSVLHNKLTKGPVRATIGVLLATTAAYFLGINDPRLSWVFLLGLISTLVVFVVVGIALNKFYKWKTQVKGYLEIVSAVKKATLTLNEHFFELQIDDRMIIQPLTSVKKIDVNPDFISIDGHEERFLFPAKSMGPEDFTKLTEYIRGRDYK